MSEENDQLITGQGSAFNAEELEDFTPVSEPIDDFEQNGLLLKIAVNGITVQDYVKKLQESDILVAVDGNLDVSRSSIDCASVHQSRETLACAYSTVGCR